MHRRQVRVPQPGHEVHVADAAEYDGDDEVSARRLHQSPCGLV